MDFNTIPRFPEAHYEVDVQWRYVESMLATWGEGMDVDLSPDYQRAHVWTPEQQTAYVEYVLQGGEVAKGLTFNCTDWNCVLAARPRIELVDGKQRLEAVRGFMRNEVPAFGVTIGAFTGQMRNHLGFKFRVCSLSREDVLRLYLNINAGGTPHGAEELERVRAILRAEENARAHAARTGSAE